MRFAVASGVLAALASAFSKVSFGGEGDSLAMRAAGLGLMLVCNLLMMKAFVQAMRDSGSVVGTTVNVSANVFASAIIGVLVFNEQQLSQKWLMGCLVAMAGVYCLSRGAQQPTPVPMVEEDKKRA
ncbi:hypothetical protein BASA81_001128 [Batrachochytrium salamandrivorans]|nr:hypothetical protein BASA81_001128 [Batrachochytrium salamandrivorans]